MSRLEIYRDDKCRWSDLAGEFGGDKLDDSEIEKVLQKMFSLGGKDRLGVKLNPMDG